MHSRHKCLCIEVEVEEDQTIEEEEETHTEVEEEALQAQVEGAAIRIQAKAQAKIKHNDSGMVNLKSNVIIAKSMGIMPMYDMDNKRSVNFTKENENHGNVLLTCNVAQEKQEDVWFLDSGVVII